MSRPNVPTTTSCAAKPRRERRACTARASTGAAVAGIATRRTTAPGTSVLTALAMKALCTATAREASTGMRKRG